MKIALATALAIVGAFMLPVAAQQSDVGPGTGINALTGDPVFVGAGDIADCDEVTDSATAALLDTIDGTVFAAGDNAYFFGSAADYTNCYEPTWGRHKLRTRPAPGNHDYMSPGAAPYYAYFGAHAGPSGQGYYSYDLGAWHIISLNSNIPVNAGSVQEQWLRADLAANPTACTLAYWHHPRYSSGQHGDQLFMRDMFQALYEFGADVVIAGHDHDYEQFHRQNADGVPDSANGIKEFVVGTGGTSLRPFLVPQPVTSAVRDSAAHGVLKLTLHPTSYDWEFVPIAGQTFSDVGSRTCGGPANPTPGGRGFAVGGALGGRQMIWTTGTVQTGYAVARITGGTTTILPGTLPPTATQTTDASAPSGQLSCFVLLPLNGSAVAGVSDVECSIPNTRSATGAPVAMVQLNQGTMATVGWSAPAGATSYALYVIPLNGTPSSIVPLSGVLRRTMHETGGAPTCYVVFALTGGSVSGNSDVLCAVPGSSTLGGDFVTTAKASLAQRLR